MAVRDFQQLFGAKHLDDKFYLEGVQRVSVRGKILREVIANSLMHREFSSSMTARLIIERDRLFADNANRAAAHGIITPENVRPVSKNPIIAAFFKEIGRADELGSGTRNLYHYTRLYSGADPIIDEEDAFSVTVPLNDGYSPEVGKGSQGNLPVNPPVNPPVKDESGTLTKSAQMVLAALENDSSLTYNSLAAKLKLHRDTVRVSIASLVKKNLLRRIGSDKTGHWEVVK